MLIGNYGGHMAFATDPPYCVAYSADYKTNDPSQMTPCHTQNHTYAMVTTNMIVRRLLSSPHWEPMDRRQTKGGRLLIPRGVLFGPALFPEIVIPRNHAGPPVDSVWRQEALLRTVGPFRAIDTIFPGFPGGLELFTAEEVVKLKELGILNPLNAPEHPLLFPLLVFPSRGKIVSAVLGVPPPGFEAHGLEQSLTTDWDKESVLSDSYSVRHSVTIDSSTMWGRPTVRISERELESRTTEHKDKDSHKSTERDRDKNRERDRDRSKKSDNRHVSERLAGILRDTETTKAITSVMANATDCAGRRVHLTAAKPSRDAEEMPVHHVTVKSRALPRVDLCHLHPCSIQLLYRRCADCLLTSQTPSLHTCPSIRVGARFLPSTWGEATPVPSRLRARLSRQAPRPS